MIHKCPKINNDCQKWVKFFWRPISWAKNAQKKVCPDYLILAIGDNLVKIGKILLNQVIP
jgi:hypothetical protein